jgi:hypothetical protein
MIRGVRSADTALIVAIWVTAYASLTIAIWVAVRAGALLPLAFLLFLAVVPWIGVGFQWRARAVRRRRAERPQAGK